MADALFIIDWPVKTKTMHFLTPIYMLVLRIWPRLSDVRQAAHSQFIDHYRLTYNEVNDQKLFQ